MTLEVPQLDSLWVWKGLYQSWDRHEMEWFFQKAPARKCVCLTVGCTSHSEGSHWQYSFDRSFPLRVSFKESYLQSWTAQHFTLGDPLSHHTPHCLLRCMWRSSACPLISLSLERQGWTMMESDHGGICPCGVTACCVLHHRDHQELLHLLPQYQDLP